MNLLRNFFKKDATVKIIVLVVFSLILYYFFTVWYRADESAHMMFSKLVAWWYRPFIDFRESHGDVFRYLVAGALKLWIPSKIFAIWFRLSTFVAYMVIIIAVIKQFIKRRDKLLFVVSENITIRHILLIASVLGITLTYSALIPDTLMILFALLWLYFLIKWNIKNYIIAWLLLSFSLLCVQKVLFVLPLLYILSLEKDFLKTYKKVILYRIISWLTMLIFLSIYVLIRYSWYTSNELRIVKESLFGINNLVHTPFNLYAFFTGFKWWGLNNLCYLLPWILFLIFSKKKASRVIIIYMTVQLALMTYLLGLMPKMIDRYFFPFFALVPIFFRYELLRKHTIIKYISIFVLFIMVYMTMTLSGQWNSLLMTGHDAVYTMFSQDYKKHTAIFYDNYAFREAYDNDFWLQKFASDRNLLKTYDYDINFRLMYDISFAKINTLPHLKYQFSTGATAETILRKYPHVYDMWSWCDYSIKMWTYDQMFNDSGYSRPPINCVPLVKEVMTLLHYNHNVSWI